MNDVFLTEEKLNPTQIILKNGKVKSVFFLYGKSPEEIVDVLRAAFKIEATLAQPEVPRRRRRSVEAAQAEADA